MTKSNNPKFRIFIFPLLLLIVVCFMFATPAHFLSPEKPITAIAAKDTVSHNGNATAVNRFNVLYDQMNLDSLGLSHEAFNYALQGYMDLVSTGALKNDHILSIVDFSLPSSKKRLFVIDVMTGKLLFNTLVSHGRGSGKEMATEFSNDVNSFKSSLGFYVTGNTYSGEHGYSLRLEGQEAGINDHAYDRSIVMHAADYVNEKVVQAKGFLGRSLGCPAVPPAVHKAIINTIKDGSCLFLYSPDQFYITHSKLINLADTLQHDTLQQPVIG
ncbi:MAG TPA: murein L,D-transpeptidase catalytic domain family protein [Niastella sp.]